MELEKADIDAKLRNINDKATSNKKVKNETLIIRQIGHIASYTKRINSLAKRGLKIFDK